MTHTLRALAALAFFAFATPAFAVIPPKQHGCANQGVYNAWKNNQGRAISCTRTKMQQAALYKRYGARQAARPGHSRHEAGCACDFTTRSLKGGASGARWLNARGHSGNHLSDTGH